MLSIRPAVPADVPLIVAMLEASAADQGFPGAVIVTAEDLTADLFGPRPLCHVICAEQDGEPAALALYYFNYSTWKSRLGLYLEDLYVTPGNRGRGIARELMRALARIGLAEGCERFLWIVHDANVRAIRFYGAIGASKLDEWTLMSADGLSLRSLAEEE